MLKLIILILQFIVVTEVIGQCPADSSRLADTKINYDTLYKEIVKQGIEFPEIVFAQAILESGHFRSRLFKSNNNIFGMRRARKRETLSKSSKKGYAYFETWQDCVKDYKIYQSTIMLGKFFTPLMYFRFLNRIYSEMGHNYTTQIKKIIKRNRKEFAYDFPAILSDGIFGNIQELNQKQEICSTVQ